MLIFDGVLVMLPIIVVLYVFKFKGVSGFSKCLLVVFSLKGDSMSKLLFPFGALLKNGKVFWTRPY